MAASLSSLGIAVEFGGVLKAARDAGADASFLSQFQGHDGWNDGSRIWDRVMREVRIDGLPIRVAQQISLGEIGAVGMIAQVAPDLRSGLERQMRFQHALTGAALGGMRDDLAREASILELLPIGDASLGWRCRREMGIASGVKFVRDLSGGQVQPRRVCFRHAEPPDSSEHEAFFGCTVQFEARYDGLEFDRDDLSIPLPGADADLSQFLVEHLRAIAGDPPAATSPFAGRVRQEILRRLGSDTLAMDGVACELGVSPRTLCRRLLEEETSYHAILDGVRRELAGELLREPGHTLAEIAFLLGFSDASGFHRAYTRWTGATPRPRHNGQNGYDV